LTSSTSPPAVMTATWPGMLSTIRRRLSSFVLIFSSASARAACDRWRSIAISAMCRAPSMSSISASVGIRDAEEYRAKVPSTWPSFVKIGSDHAARIPILMARSRYSSSQFMSVATSATMTRSFKNAAAPQQPACGEMRSGLTTGSHSRGTRVPAVCQRRSPSASINKTVDITGEATTSMEWHRSFSISFRLAPSAISSSVRFSAANRDSARDAVVVHGPPFDSVLAGCSTPAASLRCILWPIPSCDSAEFTSLLSSPYPVRGLRRIGKAAAFP